MKGSLNTMNYLKPQGFINKVRAFFKTRHSANLKTQYEVYLAKAFEFCIDFDKNGKAFFKYDGISYETFSIYEYLNYLDKKSGALVRITLDDSTLSIDKEKKFIEYCSTIDQIYKHVTFTGGYRVNDFRHLYKFNGFYIGDEIEWVKKFI